MPDFLRTKNNQKNFAQILALLKASGVGRRTFHRLSKRKMDWSPWSLTPPCLYGGTTERFCQSGLGFILGKKPKISHIEWSFTFFLPDPNEKRKPWTRIANSGTALRWFKSNRVQVMKNV